MRSAAAPPTPRDPERPRFVPVDERWLGLDRRAIPYAVVAIVLMGVLLWGLPALNNATNWTKSTAAGDVIDFGEGLTITPPVGWLLEGGILSTDQPEVPPTPTSGTALLANGGVTIEITTSGWDGTADELLDQSNRIRSDSGEHDDRQFKVTGERNTITTASGLVGVYEGVTSAGSHGVTYAFVIERGEESATDSTEESNASNLVPSSSSSVGVLIEASGTEQSLAHFDRDITAMVSTLKYVEPAE